MRTVCTIASIAPRVSIRSAGIAGAVLALASCGGGTPAADTAGLDTPAPAPALTDADPNGVESAQQDPPPVLNAAVGGKPVTLAHATVSAPGGSALELKVANYEPGCPGTRVDAPDDGVSFTIVGAPTLSQDGKREWRVISTYFAGSTRQSNHGALTVEGDASKGATFTLPALKFVSAGDDPQELTVQGSIKAEPCGTPKPTGGQPPPEPVAQEAFEFSIANTKLPIVSALLKRRKGEDELSLSTSPGTCEKSAWHTDATLTLTARGGKPETTYLRGSLFTSQMSGGFSGSPPKWVIGAEQGGLAEVTLEGSYDQNGYPVKLAGKLHATVCKAD